VEIKHYGGEREREREIGGNWDRECYRFLKMGMDFSRLMKVVMGQIFS